MEPYWEQRRSKFQRLESPENSSNQVAGNSAELKSQDSSQSQVPDSNNAFQEAARFYQAGRKNMVWQRVMEAENLKETEQQMDTVTLLDKFVVTRGPETYVVGNKRKRKFSEEIGKDAAAQATSTDHSDPDSDSSISCDGMSDSETSYIKENVQKRRAASSRMAEEKDKFTGQKILRERVLTMDDKVLPNFCARTLKERKEKWYLFVRAYNAFGRDEFLRLFFKALKIERAGGLFIKNKLRRRTPGGVFLYLARTDQRLSASDRDAVFAYDRAKELEEQLADKKFQKRKMLQSMTSKLRGDVSFNAKSGGPAMELDGVNGPAKEEEDSYAIVGGQAITPVGTSGCATTSVPRGRKLIEYSDIDEGLNPFGD